MTLKSFHSVRYIKNIVCAVFEVELNGGKCVYMTVPRSDYMNDQRYVVVVDAKKFWQLWRAEPNSAHLHLITGDAHSWSANTNVRAADNAFAAGIEDPVMLPEAASREHTDEIPIYEKRWVLFKRLVRVEKKKFNFISVSEGVAGILWLFVHGAKYFPVECDQESADKLLKSAGLINTSHATVDQLTKDYKPNHGSLRI